MSRLGFVNSDPNRPKDQEPMTDQPVPAAERLARDIEALRTSPNRLGSPVDAFMDGVGQAAMLVRRSAPAPTAPVGLREASVQLREAAVKAGAHIVVTTDYPDGVKAFGILCDAIDVMDSALDRLDAVDAALAVTPEEAVLDSEPDLDVDGGTVVRRPLVWSQPLPDSQLDAIRGRDARAANPATTWAVEDRRHLLVEVDRLRAAIASPSEEPGLDVFRIIAKLHAEERDDPTEPGLYWDGWHAALDAVREYARLAKESE